MVNYSFPMDTAGIEYISSVLKENYYCLGANREQVPANLLFFITFGSTSTAES